MPASVSATSQDGRIGDATVDEPEDDEFTMLAHASTASPRLLLISRARGALDDDAALDEWVHGLRWSDERPLPWV